MLQLALASLAVSPLITITGLTSGRIPTVVAAIGLPSPARSANAKSQPTMPAWDT